MEFRALIDVYKRQVSFQPRAFTIVLSMLGTRNDFNNRVTEIINQFAGRLVQVICSEEPTLYCIGTIEASPVYDPISNKGQLTLSCTDGDAYRYHVDETIVQVSGTKTVTLTNDFMPVVPTITTTDEATLTWRIGTDSFSKTVSAGTWEIQMCIRDRSCTPTAKNLHSKTASRLCLITTAFFITNPKSGLRAKSSMKSYIHLKWRYKSWAIK